MLISIIKSFAKFNSNKRVKIRVKLLSPPVFKYLDWSGAYRQGQRTRRTQYNEVNLHALHNIRNPTVFFCSSRCLSTLHAIYKLPPPLHPARSLLIGLCSVNGCEELDGIDFVCVGGVIVTVIIYLCINCGGNRERHTVASSLSPTSYRLPLQLLPHHPLHCAP